MLKEFPVLWEAADRAAENLTISNALAATDGGSPSQRNECGIDIYQRALGFICDQITLVETLKSKYPSCQLQVLPTSR